LERASTDPRATTSVNPDDGFRSFVAAVSEPLTRLAYVLTVGVQGQPAAGELAANALAQVRRQWREVEVAGQPEQLAVDALLSAVLKRRVRSPSLSPVAPAPVEVTGPSAEVDQQLREASWRAFVRLSPRHRALLVFADPSVAAAAARVRDETGHLDVLVNNAGIPGGFKPAGETTAADIEAVYGTNVFGVVRMTHAFLPLLQLSAAPVIVNVSSGLGSLAVTNNPDRFESTLKSLAYPSSKSALNMLTSQYAKSYPQIRINAVDPGYTATDLNSHRGTQTIEQGAEIIVAMATVPPAGPTGTFTDRHGPVPW